MKDISLEFKVIEDINDAKKIWEELSLHESLYDDWKFRFCFYNQNKSPIKFFAGRSGEKNIGLLPLQFNQEKNHLEFFGGDYMDENKVFIISGYEKLIPSFYQNVKERAFFDNLDNSQDFRDKNHIISNYVYYLSANKINDYEKYDQRFFKGSLKHCRQLQKEIIDISKQDIKITENNFSDIDIFFQYKIQQFGGESSFNNPKEKQAFIDLLKLDYNFHVFTFSLDGEKIGISIAVLFKEKYLFLEMASNFKKYVDIGKYIVIKNIEEAIKLKAKIIDISRSNGNTWKERWNFEKKSQYSFKNY